MKLTSIIGYENGKPIIATISKNEKDEIIAEANGKVIEHSITAEQYNELLKPQKISFSLSTHKPKG